MRGVGKRSWRGVPVREARWDILVVPLEEDIAKAVKGDPEHCAFAECLRRTLKSRTVFIYKRVAYIETRDEGGGRIIERYIVKGAPAKYIKDFDSGKEVVASGFGFKAPKPSQTLDTRAKAQKALGREKTKLYEARYRALKKLGRSRKYQPARYELELYREGVGQVKLIGTGKKLRKVEHEAAS